MAVYKILETREVASLPYGSGYDDTLEVTIKLQSEQTRTVRIDNSILYSMPLIGERILNYRIRKALKSA